MDLAPRIAMELGSVSKSALLLLVAVVAYAAAACARGRAEPGEVADAVQAAVELERSRSCADELTRAAGEDPDGVARALRLEPARLAPYARAVRAAPVREAIADRLEEVRANAAAAEALGTIHVEDRAGPTLEERAARSVDAARQLCRSADQVRTDRLAAKR